jgi:hypothetical protein
MKLLPSIAFNDFSGSAGNVTARKTGDKTILSTRTKHSRKKTPPQATTRCRFSDTVRAFSQITEDQRQGWISLANNLGTYYTPNGYTTISGPNLFVSINTYRKMCGKPLIAEVPAQINPSRYMYFDDCWFTPEHIVLTKVEHRENPNEVLYIEMSPAMSPGASRCWDRAVFVTICPATDWGDIDLTEAYVKKFGTPLRIGQKVFMKVSWIDAECGYLQRYSRLSFPVMEISNVHGAVYYPRAQVTMEQIVPVAQHCVCEEFDYELSPGSKITSNAIALRQLTFYLLGEDIPHTGLPGAFYDEFSYQYARITSSREYLIQSITVRIQNNGTKRVRFICSDMSFRTHVVTFGTYYVFN